eukprot:15453629-Alexandrium_andersonii.AAC.1
MSLWAGLPCLTSVCALAGIFALQGAQGAIRNLPEARQCCNPPQSAIRHAYTKNNIRRSELEQRGLRNGLKIGPRSSRL